MNSLGFSFTEKLIGWAINHSPLICCERYNKGCKPTAGLVNLSVALLWNAGIILFTHSFILQANSWFSLCHNLMCSSASKMCILKCWFLLSVSFQCAFKHTCQSQREKQNSYWWEVFDCLRENLVSVLNSFGGRSTTDFWITVVTD